MFGVDARGFDVTPVHEELLASPGFVPVRLGALRELEDTAAITAALSEASALDGALSGLICVHGGNPPDDGLDNTSYSSPVGVGTTRRRAARPRLSERARTAHAANSAQRAIAPQRRRRPAPMLEAPGCAYCVIWCAVAAAPPPRPRPRRARRPILHSRSLPGSTFQLAAVTVL